jgi:hypothetical protein
MISALFTQGVPNSTQQAGFITSESSFAFGYNGADFGILHSRGGNLENQELTITVGATSPGSCVVTVDGTGYSTPVTVGTPEHNAYEVATELDSKVPGYNFTSVGAVVYCLAQLPDFGGGAFSFAASFTGMAASWTQIKAGTLATETWINQDDWNGDQVNIDPTLGNVYQIQAQYLGYGGIFFWIKDPATSRFSLVHTLHYESSDNVPSVSNPIFRIGWACRNTGNTSDIQVKGASAGAFTEGIVHYDGRPKGICTANLAVSTSFENVLAFRNRLTFNNEANRAEIIPLLLSLSTDTTKVAVFEILENPTVTGSLIFSGYGANSLMETAEDNVLITGGDVVACFDVSATGALLVEIDKVIEAMLPGVTYSVAAKVTSGAASEMDAALTWKEDL